MLLRARVFSKALALIYLIAFVSLFFQASGLFCASGIVSISENFANFFSFFSLEKFFHLPTIFWLNHSDWFIFLIIVLAVILSVLILFDIVKSFKLKAWIFLSLYFLYLSFYVVGDVFLSFQWDVLLLETGFITVLYFFFGQNTFCEKVLVWIFRVLVFKLMFMSGLVKLSSQDPSWLNLSALEFHYYTQPLPNSLAFYVHQLPSWFHKVSCVSMFVVELICPFFIFVNQSFRRFAAWAFIVLQLLIMLTGNYGFFNLLSLILFIWLFEERDLTVLIPSFRFQQGDYTITDQIQQGITQLKIDKLSRLKKSLQKLFIIGFMIFYFLINGLFIVSRSPLTVGLFRSVAPIVQVYLKNFMQFAWVNPYGLFAVMTIKRLEIVIQGAVDVPGQMASSDWRDYVFRWKPQELTRLPSQIAPYQPRLDWQMWFAALSDYKHNFWFIKLVEKLLRNDKEVLKLLSYNPYPDSPPRYIQALVYEYKFNDFNTYLKTGEVWQRELKGVYLPQVRLP